MDGCSTKCEVYQEEEREVSIAFPTPFGQGEMPSGQPPSNEGAAAGGVDPFRSPPDEPQPKVKAAESPFVPPLSGITFQKVTEKYWEARFEPEWVVTRDVTFGGLTRSGRRPTAEDLHRHAPFALPYLSELTPGSWCP